MRLQKRRQSTLQIGVDNLLSSWIIPDWAIGGIVAWGRARATTQVLGTAWDSLVGKEEEKRAQRRNDLGQ